MPSTRRFVLPCLLLIACGGAQSPAPEAAGAEPPAPAIPQEPLSLIPGDPSSLLRVDLPALRASPHYARLEAWARSHGCARPGPGHWLLSRATVGLAAQYPAERAGAPDTLLLLIRGDFDADSAVAALAELAEASGQSATPASQRKAGRFTVHVRGELSAVQLADHMIALGHAAPLAAMLEVADGRASAGGEALKQAYGGAAWLEGHMIALLSAPEARTADRLRRQLSSFGGKRLGLALGRRPVALGLSLDADPHAELRLGYPDPEDATAALAEAQKLAWQGNLVLRLAGMPPVLDRVEMRAQDTAVELSLRLRQEEAEMLMERAERLLKARTRSRCGGQEV